METPHRDEADPFDVFGELDVANDHAWREPPPEAEEPRSTGVDAAQSAATGWSLTAFIGRVASLVWAGGMAAGIAQHYGTVETMLDLAPPVQAALAAWMLAPALLFWIAAAAAGDANKARRLVAQLKRSGAGGDAQAQRAGALDATIATAEARITELEATLQRNVEALQCVVEASRESTGEAAQALQQEHESLMALSADLRQQTDAIAQSIGRQIRLLREASKLATAEVAAAERSLEQQLTSFAHLVAATGAQTSEIRSAAATASDAAVSLNGVVAMLLEGLAEATRLTDAARASSEQAVLAANDTAGALREVTQGAILEAKRAAKTIRAETIALKRSPIEALATLQDAANEASEESTAAAERFTVAAGARPVAFSQSVKHSAALKPTRAVSRSSEALNAPERKSADRFYRPHRSFHTWAAFAPPTRAEAANEDASPLVDFDRERTADAELSLKRGALGVVAAAGVNLSQALNAEALDRIARASRDGGPARRRAVRDAAPGPVGRIARQLDRSASSHAIATRFRKRPDLAKADSNDKRSDLVRAYLLLDAALG